MSSRPKAERRRSEGEWRDPDILSDTTLHQGVLSIQLAALVYSPRGGAGIDACVNAIEGMGFSP